MKGHLVAYRIKNAIGKFSHFTVYVDKMTLKLVGERRAVMLAVWDELMKNQRDEYGNDLKKPSPTAVALRKMCVEHGIAQVQTAILEKLSFTCLTPGERP